MTSELDISPLFTFPNLESGFWEVFWVVTLGVLCVAAVIMLIMNFNAPAGQKLPTQKSQRVLGLMAIAGILVGGGAGYLQTVTSQSNHQASVCETLETAYGVTLRDCDELDVPTTQPAPDTVAFFGATDATAPSLSGSGTEAVNVTLVWDGSMLLLAATDELR